MALDPAAQRAAEIVSEAAKCNLATPGRRGAIEWIESGEVFIVGDLHGAQKNYAEIVNQANLPANPTRHIVFQEMIHGARGSYSTLDLSYRLLEMVARLKTAYPDQVHILLGNHDINELLRIEVEKGGGKSLLSFERALAAAYGEQKAEVRMSYNEFFASLAVAVRTPWGLFASHSIPSRRHHRLYSTGMLRGDEPFGEYLPGSPAYWLVWGRDLSDECIRGFSSTAECNMLVIGHFPCDDGFRIVNDSLLILDCKDDAGCYAVLPAAEPLPPDQLVKAIRPIRR